MPRHLTILFLLTTAYVGQACMFGDSHAGPPVHSKPTTLRHEYGSYVRYVPAGTVRGVVVLVHGSLGKKELATGAAHTYLGRWTTFADRERFVLLAPAFDQENFGGHSGPGGGYRGMFGRHVGADVFVNAIVDETRKVIPNLPEKFAICGHSAGGQFVSRYIVVHPERISAGVICAAGTFAFPNPDVAWTNGMKPLRRRIRWADDEPWEKIEIAPDVSGWVKAAQTPVAVIVGSRDTAEIKPIPGNPGRSHVARAQAWTQSMADLAHKHGQTSRVRYVEIADVGHNSAQLTPACQRALLVCLAQLSEHESDDKGE